MASARQIAANRRNARKSTGPRTASGKLRSRRNALRHGLTGETVIDVFENAVEYTAFEQSMIRDYRPRSTIEHQLVIRLSSLLWRLRRATAIETGLFSIQGKIIRDRKTKRDLEQNAKVSAKARLYEMLGIAPNLGGLGVETIAEVNRKESMVAENKFQNIAKTPNKLSAPLTNDQFARHPSETNPASQKLLAQCFLRVARLDQNIFERISRYEVALWRQATQATIALHALQKIKTRECSLTNTRSLGYVRR